MSSYDAFAWFYDRYWAAPFQIWEMPALERLLLNQLPPGASVVDVCCGVGHLARELTLRGFSVTGVDSSPGMLEFARKNAPGAQFVSHTAHQFTLSHQVHAAICAFDSINHMHVSETVLASFRQIRRALKPGGIFVFDFNSKEAYGEEWNKTYSLVEPDHAFILRGRFEPTANLGNTEVTMFHQQQGCWQRTDAAFSQRPWSSGELCSMLTQSGFSNIESWHAIRDLGLVGHYGLGRVYVRAS